MVNVGKSLNGVIVKTKEREQSFIMSGIKMKKNGKKKNGIDFMFLFQKNTIV